MSHRSDTTRLILAILALGCAPAAAETHRVADADRFDGTWSIEILTESGACDRAYRYPVRIERGRARFVGLPMAIEGGVAGDGAVRGSISNGFATASVVGRLTVRGVGRGTWTSTGSLDCHGRWRAERRD